MPHSLTVSVNRPPYGYNPYMTDTASTHDDLLEPYQPDWSVLETTNREGPFNEAGFYLLRELAQITIVIASLYPSVPLDRNRAILRGLVMRLAKLLRLTIRELSKKETFQLLSIQRAILEAVGTLKYLIEDEDGSHFDQFVMNGLIAERELLLTIQKNVRMREGAKLYIETRMERSIQATAEAAGITDVTSLEGRKKIGWPSAEARVKLLGTDAYVAYLTGSAETHGDWTDLYRNHLEYQDGQFMPKPGYGDVRPQLTLTPAVLVANFLAKHADALIESDSAAYLIARLEDICERACGVTELHEAMLARVAW